ncbi:long-chain-fatty-acid--CoA ligase [Thermodesulfobacteriota bacterium]
MLIGDIAKFNARRFKNKLAFKDERRALTFDQVNKRSNAIIHALMDMGVRKGDRVAILLFDCVQYGELLFALPKAGFVAVTLNCRLLARELDYLVNNSEANTIIFDAELADTIEELRPTLATVKNYIVLDLKGDSKTEALNYENLIESHSASEMPLQVHETDIAFILYTSGTTGFPKGTMLTHKSLMTNLFNLSLELQPQQKDIFFNLPPLFHAAGQNQVMVHFFHGCSSLSLREFDVETVLKTIESEKPNVMHLVPTMQNMIINHPAVGNYDLSCMDLNIYGASPIMRSQLVKVIEIFNCKLMQCAGLTEASGVLVMLRPEDHVVEGPEHLIRRLGAAGREVKLTEVRVVDQDGNEVPPETRGELVGRGENIMKGYWKMPEATAETIVDGWLHTGDICLYDEDGYIYYVDRIKDMICRGGENVFPREIEEVISAHPSVLEVSVIGVPDERLQEEIMALIVPKEGAAISEQEIVRLCEKNLARYKKARYVQFVDAFPKTASGKILKHQLRKKYKNELLPPKL